MAEDTAFEFGDVVCVRDYQWKPRVGKHFGVGCQRLLAIASALHGAEDRLEIPSDAPAVVA